MRNTKQHNSLAKSRRMPRTVTLTRAQIASIHYDMGWEPEDTETFWRYAKQEHARPGYLAQRRAAYLARIMREVR